MNDTCRACGGNKYGPFVKHVKTGRIYNGTANICPACHFELVEKIAFEKAVDDGLVTTTK